ncbi:MAG: RES family NAD+ phosphorylase [Chloroflexota bacterium]
MPAEEWNAERAVSAASTRGFQGTVWRVHWREVAPTDFSLSLRTSGRYHRGLDLFPPDQAFPALYTSLAPEIALWEMVRRSAARNLAYLQNNVLSELEVGLSRILDLSDAAATGLTAADLTGPDHQPCQELAAAAMARRYEGLLVPSAAMPGLNLVLLPRNLPDPPPIRDLHSMELPLDRNRVPGDGGNSGHRH